MDARWISDAGHRWLKVPRHEYDRAGIKASRYSYQDDGHVYLEEDCDAGLLFEQLILAARLFQDASGAGHIDGEPIGWEHVDGLSEIRQLDRIGA
jgi:hypothetical protein